jgi:quercetin dioxygenase-like cupin family protein
MYANRPRRRSNASRNLGFFFLSVFVGVAQGAGTPTGDQPDTASVADPLQVKCVPAAERAGRELGCYVIASTELGTLPDEPQYWYLDTFSTRHAATKAKGKNGKIVEAFGENWLFSIGNEHWKGSGGHRRARVGPLPVNSDHRYMAEYMEATFIPGMHSTAHGHSGPEAWYVLTGEQCLETPGQRMVVRAGESGIVPEGVPMMLVGTGTSKRRALVLVLHDSSRSMTIQAPDWRPAGLCSNPERDIRN